MGENRSLVSNVGDTTTKIVESKLSSRHDVGSKQILILVEGPDDCKVYRKLFNDKTARVEAAGGKANVIGALNEDENEKVQLTTILKALIKDAEQVIGIQDADFAHLENEPSTIDELFYTDYHDIEMTMLSIGNVRDTVIAKYVPHKDKAAIWKNVLDESLYVAYVRWHNHKNNCNIYFKKLKYDCNLVTITDNAILLNKPVLLQKLNDSSKNKTEDLTEACITNFIAGSKSINDPHDKLNLCNGHDVTALLALLIGGQGVQREFCGHLRNTFDVEHFKDTKLYAAIHDWQIKHSYDILTKMP